ncbi:MAG: sensor histidine kinase [Chloroflexi bacterium]|nr:sensor histidine kinase [Chloroflexota bacterium]
MTSQEQAAGPATQPKGRLRRVGHLLLEWIARFPLFYKVLIANTLLVVVGVVVGSWLTADHVRASPGHLVHWEFILWFGAVAVSGSLVLNYVLLRAALQPIGALHRLADALHKGNLEARADRTFFSDRDVDRLIAAVNQVLGELTRYQEQLRHLSSRVTAQLETERKNLARELHDETAQALATLLVMQRMVAREATTPKQTQALQELRELTSLTLEGVRRMSVGLRPSILDDTGLVGALHWYVEEFCGDTLPPVRMDLEESLGRLTPDTELAIYRITQEALSNIMRHASASAVSLSLQQDGNWVVLNVADDGVGFDPAAPPKEGGRESLGLFTMRERAELVGGHLEVVSRRGEGTTVRARFPLPPRPVGAVSLVPSDG